MTRIICLLVAIVISSILQANELENKANDYINCLYQGMDLRWSQEKKIAYISGQFLGRPYQLGALGEGDNANFDNDPLYRVDTFDCMTYVATVMALTIADNTQKFKEILKQINYQHGEVSYIKRNHFTSLDWNTNNQSNGFLKDITKTIKDKQDKPIYKLATTTIDKARWHRVIGEKQFSKSSNLKKTFYPLTDKFKPQSVTIAYLPLKHLFNKQGKPISSIFAQIPGGAIIEIVRPNWDLEKKIGTRLHVSHLGFAIRKGEKLYFRQASLTQKKVVDILLTDYLKAYLDSPTVKGINIQRIIPIENSE